MDRKDEATQGALRLPEWLTFPALSRAWEVSPARTIARIAERAAWYQELSGSAAPVARARARLVAVSYQRVLAVLKELEASQPAPAKTPQRFEERSAR